MKKPTHIRMPVASDTSLKEAQEFLKSNFLTGAICPCCGQHVMQFARPISTSRAVALFLLYGYEMSRKDGDDPWVYVPPFFAKYKALCNIGGEYAKLRFWKLIERKPGRRDDGSDRNGHWRITELGCRFVRKETKVPKFIYLYNNHFFGYSNELTDIEECLHNDFNYQELMGLKV